MALKSISETQAETAFGSPQRAVERSQRAVFFARCAEDRLAYLVALESRALALSVAGQVSTAITLNERIIALAEVAGHPGFAVSALHGLAGLELRMDRPERAAKALERALDMSAEVPLYSIDGLVVQQHRVAILRELPLVYQALGSRPAVEGALSAEFPGGPGRFPRLATEAGFWVDGLSRVHPAIHRIHDVRTRAGTVQRSPVELPAAPLATCSLGSERLTPLAAAVAPFHPLASLGGVVDFALGRSERALRQFESQARRNLREGRALGAAFRLSDASTTLWFLGRFDEAIAHQAGAVACFETAVFATEAIPLAETHASGARGGFYPVLVEMLSKEQRGEEAFLMAERARANVLRRSLGQERDPGRAKILPTQSRELAAARKVLHAAETRHALVAGEPAELARNVARARSNLENLLVRTSLRVPEFAALTAPRPTNVAEIQGALEPGITLLTYFVTDIGLHAWVVERDSFKAFSLEPFSKDITAVPCFSDFVRGVKPREFRCDDGYVLAEGLYRRLIAPLRSAIHRSRVVIVPHGILHFVPFGALREAGSGRLLVEDFTISYAPSAGVLRFLREKESTFAGRSLLVGAPDVTAPPLPPLVGARSELLELGALLNSPPLVEGLASEATLDQTLEERRGAIDLLHFAAHGIYFPDSPRLSRIALAPGGGQDGNLEVHEIYRRLDLTGVNLVVLSACETALGERTGGDEIVGLTRAFLYAGASGVVSTLWKVDDAASTELMVSFYLHLKAGETAAEALRDAQLEMLRRPGRQDPYYWAGFVLTGDPQARWVA